MTILRAALLSSLFWFSVSCSREGGAADMLAASDASTTASDPSVPTPLSSLVVTRVVAAWCGTCQVLVEHTARTLPAEHAARVRYVDVLLTDQDNAPATEQSLLAWRAAFPSAATTTLEAGAIASLFPQGHRPLPWIVVRREGSAEVVATLTNPSFALLRDTLEAALGLAHRGSEPLADERFDVFDQTLLGKLRLDTKPPPDASNVVADDVAAAALGNQLFFERALSPANVSCAGCHDPALVFTDGKGVPPEGAGKGQRNVPSIVLVGHARWQLWDGRADTLWAQALLPFEDPRELASSRLFVVHALATRYRATYESLFGALPALEDGARFPAQGKPGEAAWEAMRKVDQESVTQVFVNVGKSLAAFERSLEPVATPWDRYLDGDVQALTAEQKDGVLAFLRAGCAQCHHGGRLTDDAFHTLRFPTGRADGSADPGRADGLRQLAASEFRTRPTPVATTGEGAFKTPGLRGVAFTLPYGHGGAYGGLASVIEAHRTCGLPPGSPFTTGECEPWVADFSAELGAKIETFLRVLRLEVE